MRPWRISLLVFCLACSVAERAPSSDAPSHSKERLIPNATRRVARASLLNSRLRNGPSLVTGRRKGCLIMPKSAALSPPLDRHNATIAFVVLTSLATWDQRGAQMLRTWGSLVQPPHSIWLASDRHIPLSPRDSQQVRQIINGNHSNPTRGGAHVRFVRALFEVSTRQHDWIMLGDDDTWVYPERMVEFASRQDPDRRALYGQIMCPYAINSLGTFCGGAGALYSPALVRALPDLRYILDNVERNITRAGYYEGGIASLVLSFAKGVLIHSVGFHSQPPQHYVGRTSSCSVCEISETTEDEPPLTFHYVDEFHQRAVQRYRHRGCKPNCKGLYLSLIHI